MWRRGFVGAVVLATALQTACSSSGTHRETDRTPRTLGTYLTDRQRDERDINAVIQGWHRDYLTARAYPERPHPELAKWASPEVLTKANTELQNLIIRHQRLVVAPNSKGRVEIIILEQMGEGRYKVVTCEIDDNIRATSSGEPLDTGTAVYRDEWEAKRGTDGSWTLSVARSARTVGSFTGPGWERQCR